MPRSKYNHARKVTKRNTFRSGDLHNTAAHIMRVRDNKKAGQLNYGGVLGAKYHGRINNKQNTKKGYVK